MGNKLPILHCYTWTGWRPPVSRYVIHMGNDMNERIRRHQLKQDLLQDVQATLDVRIDRYLEIDHQGIIGGHYFAPASSQCIDLYRDGHFIAAVMMTHAVNEAIVKLVAERKDISVGGRDSLVDEFITKGIMTAEVGEASKRIIRSYRNDVHHMNPKVAAIDFKSLAKDNLQRLSKVEKHIFGVEWNNGLLVPNFPEFWDTDKNGYVSTYLRL